MTKKQKRLLALANSWLRCSEVQSQAGNHQEALNLARIARNYARLAEVGKGVTWN